MMANSRSLLVVLLTLAITTFHPIAVDANFFRSVYFYWGNQYSAIQGNGDDLQLVLDQTSGSGIKSTGTFLFGSIEMLIKLVPGNSAGTVTAYYVSSTGDRHDEIDFEFLGNVSGQPYIIHTNIFTQGNGNREQQFHPWFDPTADFHNYTIHWNPTAVVFKPNKQGMSVYSSLWNADNWATQGGRIKIDWNSAPFIAKYRNFRAQACNWNGAVSIGTCASNIPGNWWTSPTYSRLSDAKLGQMNWVRDIYMIYDYCKDTKRFKGQMPPECFKSQY